ncbi:GNAT family N-acetyltransferase [Candidatus Chloroploca sp. M-50]|uniref:GNAT family N-acetyltransferase n=1 Tax=Candidatus Chloroploca mongolica TaxID=2528176 RepID=A0ABS4D8L5_9CHLR|nr:GNAT family N-acetyltransferase [Candidatus Chloroploca mongolica]MBP1465765.1 GNAT family N-acetyltransferase [Candidatus Chloroploca mongolica]
MFHEAVTLQVATIDDLQPLAELVAQLHQHELPGYLHSPLAVQVPLFRYLLAHEFQDGTRGRFLFRDEHGTPVSTASIRLPDDPIFAPLPSKLFSTALHTLGVADTLRFFWTMVRGSLFADPPLQQGESFMYSVVVSQTMRNRGIGAAMMHQMEAYARAEGATSTMLRVIIGNTQARHFYLRLGYEVVSRTPAWADHVILPSELLRKDVAS